MTWKKDFKGRGLEVGQRVRVEEDISYPMGSEDEKKQSKMEKHSIVVLQQFNEDTQEIEIEGRDGKKLWIEPSKVSCSFL